jgi:putative transposase
VEVKDMTVKRQTRNAQFKFQVALEAAKGTKTVNQIASEQGLNPGQVSQWKGQLLAKGSELFANGSQRVEQEASQQEAALYEQIGRLKMELEWLKKKATRFG